MSAPPPAGPAGMVVIVPTYNRPRQLVWSLSSVLRQRLGASVVRRRVMVVNNGTPPEEVEHAVSMAVRECGPGGWSVHTVHRDPPMDPALSWYGALQDAAEPGDVAFLHGDDDLLLPGSLRARAAALMEADASCLLSLAHGGLYFDSHGEDRAFLSPIPPPPRRPLPWRRIGANGLEGSGAAFIGNHTYRIDPPLRAAIAKARGWLEALPLQGPQQLAMLPYFVALAAGDLGRLASSTEHAAIRGQSTGELTRQRFGHSSWRPGVLYLSCLWVLTRTPLAGRADLEPLRAEYAQLAARWRVPTLASTGSRREWEALGGSGLLRRHRVPLLADTLRGVTMVLRALSGTQALRSRLFRWRNGLTRQELLELLWRDSEPPPSP